MVFKFFVAIISTFFSSWILTMLFYDKTIGSLFPMFLIITGVAYIIGGIPCSILIDKFTNKKWLKFIYFILAGFLVGIVTILVFLLLFITKLNVPSINIGQTLAGGISIGIYGVTGAIIFYFFELLLSEIKKKLFN